MAIVSIALILFDEDRGARAISSPVVGLRVSYTSSVSALPLNFHEIAGSEAERAGRDGVAAFAIVRPSNSSSG